MRNVSLRISGPWATSSDRSESTSTDRPATAAPVPPELEMVLLTMAGLLLSRVIPSYWVPIVWGTVPPA